MARDVVCGDAIEIVPARAEHAPAVRACAGAAYQRYVARIGRKPAPMVAEFEAQIAAGQVHVLLVSGQICGFVVCYPRNDHFHLENVAVDPAYHGRGLGRRLISFAETEAARLGYRAVELYTNEKMTENIELYPRLGYREVGRRKEDGFNRVFYRKPIEAAEGARGRDQT